MIKTIIRAMTDKKEEGQKGREASRNMPPLTLTLSPREAGGEGRKGWVGAGLYT
jgi:hypothetical protein